MSIARRIRAIRLEHYRSIETTEARAGLQKGLLVRLENGQQVPAMENLQRLAAVLGAPVHRRFFADGEPVSTSCLTLRLSLDDLATFDLPASRGRPN